MYDRKYDNKIFTFEPSGGLINASLVMQDFETDTYWSIMTNEAIEGKHKGIKLKKIPTGAKMKWKDWVLRHPNTLVLSVQGKEDTAFGYTSYFHSERGFNGLRADDHQLSDKTMIFAFEYEGQKYAVENSIIEEGKSFDLGKVRIFLYRPESAEMFKSTVAFKTTGKGFARKENSWIDLDSDCYFDENVETFAGRKEGCPQNLIGLDTFWYTWILMNPDTQLLE